MSPCAVSACHHFGEYLLTVARSLTCVSVYLSVNIFRTLCGCMSVRVCNLVIRLHAVLLCQVIDEEGSLVDATSDPNLPVQVRASKY
jgi:hypothetical protein